MAEPDHTQDPDYGKDLSNLVPHVAVMQPWNGQPGPPSFNEDPSGGKSDSGDSPPVLPVSPISANLMTLRTGEMSLTAATTSLIADYEELREKVMSVKDTVYGQNATITTHNDPSAAAGGGGSGGMSEQHGPSDIQGPAHDFANSINPAQERVLEQIANSIEIVGQFIAGVNRSGQSYGMADRKSVFPDPPPSPVH
jgi:hypothetical protein